MIKFLLIAAAALSMVAAPIAASAQPYGHGGYAHGGYRGDGGAVLAAGLFGLVLGAVAADAASQPVAYAPAYYGPQCVWQTQAYRNAWGQLEYQQVQVCR